MTIQGSFKHLFEPVRIGTTEIKNRIALAPMGTGSILVDSEGKLGREGLSITWNGAVVALD